MGLLIAANLIKLYALPEMYSKKCMPFGLAAVIFRVTDYYDGCVDGREMAVETRVEVDTGVNITEIKKHGGWNFTTVTEGYIDQSIIHKKAVAERIIPTAGSSVTVASSTSLQDLTANADEIGN